LALPRAVCHHSFTVQPTLHWKKTRTNGTLILKDIKMPVLTRIFYDAICIMVGIMASAGLLALVFLIILNLPKKSGLNLEK
jgi:hypothetical protein